MIRLFQFSFATLFELVTSVAISCGILSIVANYAIANRMDCWLLDATPGAICLAIYSLSTQLFIWSLVTRRLFASETITTCCNGLSMDEIMAIFPAIFAMAWWFAGRVCAPIPNLLAPFFLFGIWCNGVLLVSGIVLFVHHVLTPPATRGFFMLVADTCTTASCLWFFSCFSWIENHSEM